jgi:acetolactate synthase-1/2/3 large subunit
VNGAEVLVETLLAGGVDLCFANPGTSEMQFVAALDRQPGMRCVLGLFEGVVTGAADGYARMTDKPACTLLHLAPGLANGWANLHNARRAQVPLVNIVGEHRQGHKATDSPLVGEIEPLAGTVSHWSHTATSADELPHAAARAIREANSLPGRIATLILPADTAWSPARRPGALDFTPAAATLPDAARMDEAARVLRSGARCVLVLSGRALRAPALADAARIARHTGARVVAQYANGRIERGAGRFPIQRTPAPVDAGVATFRDADHVILAGAATPAPMFGYPGKPDFLVQPPTRLLRLTQPADDLAATLRELAERVGAGALRPILEERADARLPTGELTPDAVLRTVAAFIPEGGVVVDESISAGRNFFPLSRGAAPHDYLQLTGGAIGAGIPMATGAALGAPGRKVINLEGDGSSMYTIQGLWTQARERLDVVTVVFANRGYQILKGELANVGATQWGARAERMLSIAQPDISWVGLAQAMGVEAAAASTCEQLASLLRSSLSHSGPFLVEARIGAR